MWPDATSKEYMRNGMMPVSNMVTITAAACVAVTLGVQPASAQESRIVRHPTIGA
jgi:negative regulator of sigma E activity